MIPDNRALKAASRLWGEEAQLRMVGEEATELVLAMWKFLRARARIEGLRPDTGELERKAIEAGHVKAIENLIEEACDVWLMLEQLEIIIPAKWEQQRERTYRDFLNKLRAAGISLDRGELNA